jgi:hypothetical protein
MVWGAHHTLRACYLYIKRNVEKVLGAPYLPEKYGNLYTIMFYVSSVPVTYVFPQDLDFIHCHCTIQ